MLVTGQAGMDDLSGPVGIVSTITQVGTASETIAAAVETPVTLLMGVGFLLALTAFLLAL